MDRNKNYLRPLDTTTGKSKRDMALLDVAEGESLRKDGHFRSAVQKYRDALKTDELCFEAWNGLGNTFAAVKDRSTAYTFFKKACEINPKNATIHNNLANILLHKGSLTKSIEHYRTAILLDPGNATFLNNYGNALRRGGQFIEAENAFREALRFCPNYAEAQVNLEPVS